jgi:hypothetical protein
MQLAWSIVRANRVDPVLPVCAYSSFKVLPAIKTLDQSDFEFAVGAPQQQIRQLAGSSFIERAENVILLGPLSVGKIHLAVGLGYLATQAEIKTRSVGAARLVLSDRSAPGSRSTMRTISPL